MWRSISGSELYVISVHTPWESLFRCLDFLLFWCDYMLHVLCHMFTVVRIPTNNTHVYRSTASVSRSVCLISVSRSVCLISVSRSVCSRSVCLFPASVSRWLPTSCSLSLPWCEFRHTICLYYVLYMYTRCIVYWNSYAVWSSNARLRWPLPPHKADMQYVYILILMNNADRHRKTDRQTDWHTQKMYIYLYIDI